MDLVDFFEKFIKIVTRYWDVFLIKGLSTTLALSAIAVFFGAIIGTLLAFGKMGKSRILRGIITAYVEIIRGTPSLLQVYICKRCNSAHDKQLRLCVGSYPQRHTGR